MEYSVTVLLISIITIFINFIIHLIDDETEKKTGCLVSAVNTLALILIIVFTITYINKNTPTSLDVYRGNTELEIHSVNGIPTDTIVIYKKK